VVSDEAVLDGGEREGERRVRGVEVCEAMGEGGEGARGGTEAGGWDLYRLQAAGYSWWYQYYLANTRHRI
jgi:hypothetical protein